MEDIETITEVMDAVSLEDIGIRHRRERKELQAKIQELKKNAPKSDKKKRKEAMEAVARIESELEKRHDNELKAALEANRGNTTETTTSSKQMPEEAADVNITSANEETAPHRVSKAQKRRNKKEREAREREKEILAAAENVQFAPKAIESSNLKAKLLERFLALHEIASDGDCLYNAICHQLQQHGLDNLSVSELRKQTANYLRTNKESLIFYMTDTQTGKVLNDDEFEEYCNAVESTAAWGGQIELKAISSVLKVPIEVLQAQGPPTVQGGEFSGPHLVITYHRHMYSLGEHYNSTKPLEYAALKDGDTDS